LGDEDDFSNSGESCGGGEDEDCEGKPLNDRAGYNEHELGVDNPTDQSCA
jgi:hypothetical protein